METLLHERWLSNIGASPQAADGDATTRGLDRWIEGAKGLNPRTRERVLALAADDRGRAILCALFGNSPFLSACALAEPAFMAEALSSAPDDAFDRLLRALPANGTAPANMEATTEVTLRRTRRRTALLIALADITGTWSIARSARALSDFAEAAVTFAVASLLGEAAKTGDLDLPDKDNPGFDSGYIVLGMGKLGGRELNFSSDIDLIVLFEPAASPYRGRRDIQDFFVRMTRRLVALLEERTAEGYVLRTDLRLRPDPGATPLALSTLAAEAYYESLGQNWERAAMIKARPVAGDIAAGQRFLEAIRPFVWRKHLDFAAIQDIHAIKRQIQAHRGGETIAVADHNIKLGRGGIREIEFFAQTEQLIWGGRHPDLRTRRTVDALTALRQAGRIPEQAERELTDAYWFLRWVEHRLQMIDDQQTHTLPADDAGLAHLAIFLGFDDPQRFVETLRNHLRIVAKHYGHLFSDTPELVAPIPEGGSLVFTGVDDDQETLTTLRRMGFVRPDAVSGLVRDWHRGRIAATRSARAREILTTIIPSLLHAVSGTVDPDGTLLRFDRFLSGLPAGVQLLSTLQSNPELLDILAEIMGSAPRLSLYLSRRSMLVDALLDSRFFEPPPDREGLRNALAEEMARAEDLQERLDAARRWAGDAKFQLSVQQLRGLIDADAAGITFTNIADLIIEAMLETVTEDFARRYGVIDGASVAILGFGKLGSRSLVRGSDLDLVMVYDSPSPTLESNGSRALAAPTYFARLCQRLVTAVETQTNEGQLYEIDLRLRPMGKDGPIATTISALEAYYRESAWTWELMALTRARVVTGPAPLARRLDVLVRKTLTQACDRHGIAQDILDMRRRIAAEHGTDKPWSIKHVRGGLIDVEFIAQYLQLRFAGTHSDILDTNTSAALGKLAKAGLLPGDRAEPLIQADRLYHSVQAILRLCLSGVFDEETAPEGLRRVLARSGGAVDIADLKAKLLAAQAIVRDSFAVLVGTSASDTTATNSRGEC